MLTVKHIRPDQTENIHETGECRYEPATSSVDRSPTPETVWIDCGPITGGKVFVMNATGKTIARYDLSAPEMRAP